MSEYTTYIQQLLYDGTEYAKGAVVDVYDTFGAITVSFPFKMCEDAKEVSCHDYCDGSGREVYIPANLPMKEYDVEVEFGFKGTEGEIRENVRQFILFLRGARDGDISARLAIYNTATKIGRKDVHLTKIDESMTYIDATDDEKAVCIKVTFKVEDPVTDVSPVITGNKVTALAF